MKSRRVGRPTVGKASEALVLRWLGTFTLALGVLLLPLAASQDSAWLSGSCAVAGNGPGGGGPGGGGPGDGGPGDGGGNAGSGKGGSKGGGKSDKGDLYGDMIYIKRDADGVPITIPLEGEGGVVDCAIPIAWNGTEWEELPLYGQLGYDPTVPEAEDDLEVPRLCLADEYVLDAIRIRLQKRDRIQDRTKDFTGDKDMTRDRIHDRDRIYDRLELLLQLHQSATYGMAWGSALEDVDGELGACDTITVCANNAMEVDLGRLSVLRAPERVLDKSRDEIFKVLLKSSGFDSPTLDASGRLTVDDSTFDSPLVNLALYREYHKFWQLQDTNAEPNAYIIPGSDDGLYRGNFGPDYGPYLAMAFGLAAGSDKEGSGVDIDVVSRVNAILGLPGNEYHIDKGNNYEGFPDTLSTVIEGNTHYFIDYGDFSYDRSTVFPGDICYIDVTTMTEYQYSSVMEFVFGTEGNAIGENITGFALAANDARRVLAAIHGLGPLAVHWVDPVFTDSGRGCPEVQ